MNLQLTVSVDAARKLGIHSEMMGITKSSLVEDLINAHLKRFVVSDRERPPASPEGAEGEGS